ncbi:MAG: 16S rRNA (adenine(1518)-N(6)/adenine(1519)-N(6))-dimethyltransferase RsmA [Kiloniellales bacterium]
MPEPAVAQSIESLAPLREVIAQHGLSARKALGQNFLLDLNLTRRIARAGGALGGGTVIEVGPGPGGLTRALLLEGARCLVAIEKDVRCVAALGPLVEAARGSLALKHADALAVDLETLGPPPRRVVANLPYNLATALLLQWLASIERRPGAVERLTLLFQKEVAARLTAEPRSGAYGRLSVIAQWLCDVERLFDIPPRAFTPPPKVISTLVALTPRARPLAPASRSALEAVSAAAFGQRRKMLRQSLKSLGVPVAPLLAAADAPETARAEELSVEQFCALARALEKER